MDLKHSPHTSSRRGSLFTKIGDHEYVCHTWFERDRSHLRLETPRGRIVVELWDEDVEQAIADGFLKPPHHPFPCKAREAEWQPRLVAYARDLGLIT